MKHFESKAFDLYQNRGSLQYQGEALDQLSHGWLCAKNARISSASSALCLAAFLHDIGHLFNERETPTLEAINDRHEVRGADYLSQGLWKELILIAGRSESALLEMQWDYRLKSIKT
jgi:predicted HD phosphohydrolase